LLEDTELETLISDLLDSQFYNPVSVIAFNRAEGSSRNVSEDVAHGLMLRGRLDPRVDLALLTDCVCASFRNARFLFLGHMPDHDVVMRHVHSGVTRVKVEAEVVSSAREPRRLE
jgi:hypothetical protein